MLTIGRKLNEMLRIGDDLTVKVVSMDEGKVGLTVFSSQGDIQHALIAVNETLEINQDVKIMATQFGGGKRVRLGITAPRDTVVYRLPAESETQSDEINNHDINR